VNANLLQKQLAEEEDERRDFEEERFVRLVRTLILFYFSVFDGIIVTTIIFETNKINSYASVLVILLM